METWGQIVSILVGSCIGCIAGQALHARSATRRHLSPRPADHVDSYMHERSPASKRGSWQELEYHACHDQEPLHQCRRSMIYFTGFVGASCMHMPNAKFTVNGVILQYNVDNVLMKITFQTGSQLREMRWQRAVGFLYIYVKKNSIARKGE